MKKISKFLVMLMIVLILVPASSSVAFGDTSLDTWVTKAPMNTNNTRFITKTINGKIYAIGESSPSFSNLLEEYNPETNIWSVKAPMLYYRLEFGAESINGKLYVMGGMVSNGTLASLEEYNPQTDTWTSKAPMPYALNRFETVVVNNKIYVIGGSTQRGGNSSDELFEYDPATNIWTTKASMPLSRYWFQANVVNGKIYVMGGSTPGYPMNSVVEYDPKTNVWSSKANMPTAKYAFKTNVVNNKIYAFGLEDTNSVDEYNTDTDTWTTITPMSVGRDCLETTVYNGKLYAIGGYNQSSMEEYDDSTNTWMTKPSMSIDRYNFGSELIDDKLYVMGGVSQGNVINSVEEYTLSEKPIVTPATSITLNKYIASLLVNQSDTLIPTVTPTNATNQAVTWTSSDPTTVTVDSTGKITGIKAGTATITVASVENPSLIATCSVTVSPQATTASAISLNKTIDSLNVGQTDALIATIQPTNATNQNIIWTSSDPTIATVDANGKITAIKTGSVTITATSAENANLKATCLVNVTDSTTPVLAGSRCILEVTMTNDTVKEYDLSTEELNAFQTWYDARSGNAGKAYYTITKHSNIKPFTSRKETLVFDKIFSFEVKEYTN